MRIIGPSEVTAALDFSSLIETLRQIFRTGCEVPPAQEYQIAVRSGSSAPDADEDAPLANDFASLRIMPAWQVGKHIGIQVCTQFPNNEPADLPRAMGTYLLLDGRTGELRALLDGRALTLRRAAAASALAANYLARPDCERLLIVGTGALAPHLVEAHAVIRPIRNVLVWGRDFGKARRLAQRLDRRNLKVAATEDLQGAVRGAHIISCATAATEPLIHGGWLPLGAHLDLVGGLTAEFREADDEAIRRGRIFVDTRAGALRSGDIAQPLESGVLHPDDIAGDLFELAQGSRAGRRFHDQITIFKAAGTAFEDLAAAQLALERALN